MLKKFTTWMLPLVGSVILSHCNSPQAFMLRPTTLEQPLRSEFSYGENDTTTQPPSIVDESLKEYPLSWEYRKASNRSWSEITLQEISKHFQTLDQAQDTEIFCPRYYRLPKGLRQNFWGQLISAMAYYESGWNPYTRFHEKTMGIDPVTKEPVYSEGLLQLSYQDKLVYPWCDFDWNQDRKLPRNDPRKTIFDPQKNLSCGIGIMSHQIRRYGRIVIGKGAYWAVIKSNSRFQKIAQIRNLILKYAPYCR